jgi:hypothetical protein
MREHISFISGSVSIGDNMCHSLGIERDDGDFHILATLNNNDGLIGKSTYADIVNLVKERLSYETGEKVIALNRQDTPDYINTEVD